MNTSSIYKQIKIDSIKAMKEHNNEKRDILRVVLGEFDRVRNINDEEALGIIKKMHGNAVDLKNEKEEKVLAAYLPQMLEPKEIKIIVERIIEFNNYGPNDMGLVMKQLRNIGAEASQIDMKTASIITKEILS